MSRSLGKRSFTTRPAILISPPVISSSPATMRKTLVLPQPEGPTNTVNSPSPISRSSGSTARVPSGYVFSSSTSAISATRELQQHLAACTARFCEHGECALVLVQCECVRDERTRSEAARVEERHHACPPGGRIAEARDDRKVIVHDAVGREQEGGTGRRESEEERSAAAAERPDRRKRCGRRSGRFDREVEAAVRVAGRKARRSERSSQSLLLRPVSCDQHFGWGPEPDELGGKQCD